MSNAQREISAFPAKMPNLRLPFRFTSLFAPFFLPIWSVFLIACFSAQSFAQIPPECRHVTKLLGNGGALVESPDGVVYFGHRAGDAFIPASTLKIATTLAALETFGPEHRFKTEFSLDDRGRLVVKGYGDPGLVSEELPIIAKTLANRVRELNGIVIDESHFSPDILIDGIGGSSNPYDALNGAVLINYNTVYVRRTASGKVLSAETQTPLTPTAARLGALIPKGSTKRINLGKDRRTGLQHFAELLTEFLQREGVKVTAAYDVEVVTRPVTSLYVHRSSQTLRNYSQALLKYSTNFLTNQIFLLLGVERHGPPATIAKGREALGSFLEEKVGWRDFAVHEGAGLSRKNRVSPRQLVTLLEHFSKYEDLLPIERQYFLAKTGSLTGVSTLAGFMTTKGGKKTRFAVMVNDRVDRNQRFVVANALRSCL